MAEPVRTFDELLNRVAAMPPRRIAGRVRVEQHAIGRPRPDEPELRGRRLARAPEGARCAKARVVQQHDEHVGRALGRAQPLDRWELGVRVLCVIGDQFRLYRIRHRQMCSIQWLLVAH